MGQKNQGAKTPKGQGAQYGKDPTENLREDRADFFIRCACDNLICRQSKQDPNTFRFKEKEFYLEVVNPSSMSTRCRRCARTCIIPNRVSQENFDIVADASRLRAEMEAKRKGRDSPQGAHLQQIPEQKGGEKT